MESVDKQMPDLNADSKAKKAEPRTQNASRLCLVEVKIQNPNPLLSPDLRDLSKPYEKDIFGISEVEVELS